MAIYLMNMSWTSVDDIGFWAVLFYTSVQIFSLPPKIVRFANNYFLVSTATRDNIFQSYYSLGFGEPRTARSAYRSAKQAHCRGSSAVWPSHRHSAALPASQSRQIPKPRVGIWVGLSLQRGGHSTPPSRQLIGRRDSVGHRARPIVAVRIEGPPSA